MDPSARVAVPVVQVLEALPRGVRDPELVCARGFFYIHSLSSHMLRASGVPGDAGGVEMQGESTPFPREMLQTLTRGEEGVKCAQRRDAGIGQRGVQGRVTDRMLGPRLEGSGRSSLRTAGQTERANVRPEVSLEGGSRREKRSREASGDSRTQISSYLCSEAKKWEGEAMWTQ